MYKRQAGTQPSTCPPCAQQVSRAPSADTRVVGVQASTTPLACQPRHRPEPPALGAGAGGTQDAGDLFMSAALGMPERRRPVPVGQVDIRPGVDEGADRAGVRVPALAKDDRLEQRGPAEPVDVIDLDVGLEQPGDDAGMTAFCGTDEAGAVVAVLGVDIRAGGEG